MGYFRVTCCALLASTVSALGAHAHAQAVAARTESSSIPRETAAQAHFERAATLYAQGDLSAAIEAFTASYRLAPTPNVAFNIAQTYELVERFEEAFNWYQACSGSGADETALRARERIDALLPKVAVLSLTVEPAGAVLAVDSVEQAQDTRSPRQLAVTPGPHRVSARCAGCVPADTAIDAQRGRIVAASLRAEPLPGTLTVETTPQGASVLLHPNMRFLGVTPLSIQLPAGSARLTLRLPGYDDRQITPQIRSEIDTTVSLRLPQSVSPQARPFAVDALGTAAARDQQAPRGGLGNWRWVGYGTAATLAGAGIVLGVMAVNKQGEVQADPARKGKDDLMHLNLAADLTMGAAVVIAVSTLILDLSLEPSRGAR